MSIFQKEWMSPSSIMLLYFLSYDLKKANSFIQIPNCASLRRQPSFCKSMCQVKKTNTKKKQCGYLVLRSFSSPLHLTSSSTVWPCVLRRDRRAVYTGEPVAVALRRADSFWLVFSWPRPHFHVVALSLACPVRRTTVPDHSAGLLPGGI